MALVEGGLCLVEQQVCLVRDDPGVPGPAHKNNCLRFKEPSVCLSKGREARRFCIDRREWPNREGEKPRVLVSWAEAGELCASVGKRLCAEREWLLACEGEEMRPYVTGFSRARGTCNYDRPYRARTFAFTRWDECMADPACKEAFEEIDQRVPSGSLEGCRSPEGVFDLNGNVNEWVVRETEKGEPRSGLKGGWWGPVRNRCRPTVTFHGEGDFGYEVGFRCCKDAGPP